MSLKRHSKFSIISLLVIFTLLLSCSFAFGVAENGYTNGYDHVGQTVYQNDQGDYGFLRISKNVVGDGTNSGFKVSIYNSQNNVEKTRIIAEGSNPIITLKPGSYRIEETDSLGAKNVAYSTQEFEILNNRVTDVIITNSFNEPEEVVVEEPPVEQPREEIAVNEPQPELPKTGADIFGMGLGLLLAGSGMLIRKYRK